MGFMIGNKVYHYAFGVSTITNVAFNLNDHTMEFTIEKLSSNNNFYTTLTGVKPDDIYKLEIGEYVVDKLTNKICKIKNVYIYSKSLLVVYDGNRSEYLGFDDARGLDIKEENDNYFKRNIASSTLNSHYGLVVSKDHFVNNIFEEMSKYQYRKLPKIDKVIFNDPATIIFWKDSTKTVVKCHDRDCFDKEKGFAMACLKKVLGNCGHYYEEVKKWVQ